MSNSNFFRPEKDKCLVIELNDETLSLIFASPQIRRAVHFIARVHMTAVQNRWSVIKQTYLQRQREAGISGDGIPTSV